MEAQVAKISIEKEVKQDKKEEVPKQELKPLPIHLKYAFLGIVINPYFLVYLVLN